jgi:hypothetical protein
MAARETLNEQATAMEAKYKQFRKQHSLGTKQSKGASPVPWTLVELFAACIREQVRMVARPAVDGPGAVPAERGRALRIGLIRVTHARD